jgi:hypothetical protein
VDAFRLYVTTSPDPLLRRAIEEERGGVVRSYAYSIAERPQDLPARLDEMQEPLVYQLLGTSSVTESYALTEEDTLEFMHSLQSSANRPRLLFDELRNRSLLIVGSGYADWLTRFFLRTMRGLRLRDRAPTSGFLADVAVGRDPSLVRFLRHFSDQIQIFPGDPRDFVRELAERWQAHSATRPAPDAALEAWPDRRIEPQAVFISYAHEDVEAAAQLADELRQAGLPVWFDRNALQSGERFGDRIGQAIARCSLFIPVLSRHVITYDLRYFFREWNAAADVAASAGGGRDFIVPCRIDDVPPDHQTIPSKIREIHAAEVTDDESRHVFVARVKALFRKYQLQHTSS